MSTPNPLCHAVRWIRLHPNKRPTAVVAAGCVVLRRMAANAGLRVPPVVWPIAPSIR